MASTAVELLRRRLGGMAKAVKPKVTYGSFVVEEDSIYQEITHNLDTDNYVIMFKNKNERTNVNCIMEGFLIKGISKYNVRVSNVFYNTILYISEARSAANYNVRTSALHAASIENYATSTSARLYAGSATYQFLKDEEYEWIAISLDNCDAEEIVTITTSSNTFNASNTLGETSIFAALLIGEPTFDINGCVASFNCSSYLPYLGYICLESRATYGNYTSPFRVNSNAVITSSEVPFKSRVNTYPLQTGDYTILMTKI